MKLIVWIDDHVVEQAQEVAHKQGVGLDTLVMRDVEDLAQRCSGERLSENLRAMWADESGRSEGRAYRREDAYADLASFSPSSSSKSRS